MNITDVQIHLVYDDPKLKAYVAVIIDSVFVVKDMKVIEGNNGVFVAMPNKKGKDGIYRDIAHPINSDTRKTFEATILNAYRDKVASEQRGSSSSSHPVA